MNPPSQQPIPLPRALIFLASIWMIGSWVATIGLSPPVHPSSSSYEPGVRLMLVCLAAGLLIAWPLLRLSQAPAPAPRWQTILDLIVLVAMVQVVIWPLRLVTRWSLERTAALDALLLSWTVVVAVIVASAIGSASRGLRTMAMLGCVVLVAAGPLLGWMLELPEAWNAVNIVGSLNDLAEGGGAPVASKAWIAITVPLTAAVLATIGLMLAGRRAGD